MIQDRPSHAVLEASLERRFDLVHGHDRLAVELHHLAVDIVGRAEHDEIGPAEKAQLHRAMAVAVARTEVEAADRLVHELVEVLAETSDELLLRLARAETRRNLGLD